MEWKIEWRDDGKGVATHVSGLQLWITRNGWATVAQMPQGMHEYQATVLMAELQRLIAEADLDCE